MVGGKIRRVGARVHCGEALLFAFGARGSWRQSGLARFGHPAPRAMDSLRVRTFEAQSRGAPESMSMWMEPRLGAH